MVYNLSGLENITSYMQIISVISQESNGWFGAGLLLMIFVISFIMFKHHDTKAVFTGTSFFVIVLGLLLNGIGLVSLSIVIYAIVLFIASLIAYIWW